MKKIFYIWILVLTTACSQNKNETNKIVDFNSYWYSGKAEITSYKLEQARYGEIRKGYAVNVFVTEPFSKKDNTKADLLSDENINVLKLNATKKFNTGIYPYSIMTSTFLPINKPKASLKISSSTQEWCGHEYIELVNNKDNFKLSNYSYFQGESFLNKVISKDVLLEDDVWSLIRLAPKKLMTGTFNMLPGFVYLRFSHQPVKAYKVKISLIEKNETSMYKIYYPTLDRRIVIEFENIFPYKITSWKETYYNGFGAKRKLLTTKATAIKSLNIPYWQKNSNNDLYLRKELGLD